MDYIFNYSLTKLKPQVVTPKDTTWYYKATNTDYHNIRLYFTLNEYESISAYYPGSSLIIPAIKYNNGLTKTNDCYIDVNGYGLEIYYSINETSLSSFSITKSYPESNAPLNKLALILCFSIIFLLLFIAGVILWVVWINRSNRNDPSIYYKTWEEKLIKCIKCWWNRNHEEEHHIPQIDNNNMANLDNSREPIRAERNEYAASRNLLAQPNRRAMTVRNERAQKKIIDKEAERRREKRMIDRIRNYKKQDKKQDRDILIQKLIL